MSPRVSDAAKRIADTINLMVTYNDPWDIRNQWMAFKLDDGTSDGALYDNKQQAVSHQLDEKLCCYICFRNVLGGISAVDAQIFLDFNRQAYDAGLHMPDPDDMPRRNSGLITPGGGPSPIHSIYRYPEIEIPWLTLP